MPKMNPELKAKWVAALREPGRKQTTGVLRHADAMCCLGVLCDVIDPTEWTSTDGMYWSYGYSSTAVPPQSIVPLVGFAPDYKQLLINGRLKQPQEHNDVYKATFLQIADAIEEQW